MSIESCYIKHDEYVSYHEDDPDLTPIKLKLPKPPALNLIDGYGLVPEDQRFKPLEIPSRLINLEISIINRLKEENANRKSFVLSPYKIQKQYWNTLEADPEKYEYEINFIKRLWWHRLHGYWFFNRGKPTYITGWHFFYLNFWKMSVNDEKTNIPKIGLPSYKDRDRKEFIFYKYCHESTETFKDLDEDGYAIKNSKGGYDMIDVGRKIFFGMCQSKNRRSGNTNKGLVMGIELTTRTVGTDGMGILSYTGDNAKQHFIGKLVPGFFNIPLFFQPSTTSLKNTQSKIQFDVVSSEYNVSGLKNKIDYGETSDAKAYDGGKLIFCFVDESGKTVETSVSERWRVLKHCLSQGNGKIIFGFSFHPSTVEEMTEGGADYKQLLDSSCIYKRNKMTGQTSSGLARIFIPADEGLDDYVDSYGYSVKGELRDYQIKEGFTETATEYLMAIRNEALKENTIDSLRKYRAEKKLFPLSYADCWLSTTGDIGFDIEKIDKRIAVLERKSETRIGDLVWRNNVFGGEVEWMDNPNGRFEKAIDPQEKCKNKNHLGNERYSTFEGKNINVYTPLYPEVYVLGADPFRFNNAQEARLRRMTTGKNSKQSDGGIAVYWRFDEELDGKRSIEEWESARFVLSYRYRAKNSEEYNEDVLKAAIYYGAMIYPETNIEDTWRYIIQHGYGGYLLHDVDKIKGSLKEKPGCYSLTNSKQDIFRCTKNYIDQRCHKESFLSYLKECKNIRSMEQMRIMDRFTAHGLALRGDESTHAKFLTSPKDRGGDISSFAPLFNLG